MKPKGVVCYSRAIPHYPGRRPIYAYREITKGNETDKAEVIFMGNGGMFFKVRIPIALCHQWQVDKDDYLDSTKNKLPKIKEGKVRWL